VFGKHQRQLGFLPNPYELRLSVWPPFTALGGVNKNESMKTLIGFTTIDFTSLHQRAHRIDCIKTDDQGTAFTPVSL
jgi:hypothetical protein